MKKSLTSLALAAAFAAPAFAQTPAPAAAPAAAAEPASPHTFTGNMTIVSDYRFRGISQTFGQPAIQGGVDYSHSSGIYLGNWNSNVAQETGYPGGNLEMDFYGGWKKTWGDWGIDLGGLYYYYPGTTNKNLGSPNLKHPTAVAHGGNTNNFELYIAGSWKFITAKYSHSTTDYFGVPKTKGTGYWDLSANYDLGGGWGVNGHVGYTDMKGFRAALPVNYNGKYTDWKLGVTKDFSGWVVGVAYVGTDAKDGGNCNAGTGQWYHYCKGTAGAQKNLNAGKDTLVVSLSKTF